MADLQTCLKFAVGLSTHNCACTTSGRPSDYSKSLSGYYLDSMSDGIPLEYPASLEDCGSGTVWDILEAARVQGINEFKTLFLTNAMQHTDNSIVPNRSRIGDPKITAPYYVSKPYIGMMLLPKTKRGGVYTMTQLNLTMNGNGTIQVQVYASNNLATPVTTVTFNTVADVTVTHVFPQPVMLPFVDEVTGYPITYYFVYERNGLLPKDVRFDCGCGYDHKWMENFTHWNGFQISNLSELNGVNANEGYTMGLQIDGFVTCDVTKWMCMSDWDFQNNPFAAVISKAIQLLSINKMIGYLLNNSTTINRFTLMPREGLIDRFNMNKQAIDGQMVWLGQNLAKNGSTLTDCFTCRANSIYNLSSMP